MLKDRNFVQSTDRVLRIISFRGLYVPPIIVSKLTKKNKFYLSRCWISLTPTNCLLSQSESHWDILWSIQSVFTKILTRAYRTLILESDSNPSLSSSGSFSKWYFHRHHVICIIWLCKCMIHSQNKFCIRVSSMFRIFLKYFMIPSIHILSKLFATSGCVKLYIRVVILSFCIIF